MRSPSPIQDHGYSYNKRTQGMGTEDHYSKYYDQGMRALYSFPELKGSGPTCSGRSVARGGGPAGIWQIS